MSGTYVSTMGDRGRLVVPAELRERSGLKEGQPLIFVETTHGLLLMTRSQLRDLVRSGLEGKNLVASLLADRHEDAAREDAP